MSSAPEKRDPLKRFQYYWENAERIRERNRHYYYTSRGLAVPPLKKYQLRTGRDKEALMVQLAALDQELQEQKAALDAREALLVQREQHLILKERAARQMERDRGFIKNTQGSIPRPPPIESEWCPNYTISFND